MQGSRIPPDGCTLRFQNVSLMIYWGKSYLQMVGVIQLLLVTPGIVILRVGRDDAMRSGQFYSPR